MSRASLKMGNSSLLFKGERSRICISDAFYYNDEIIFHTKLVHMYVHYHFTVPTIEKGTLSYFTFVAVSKRKTFSAIMLLTTQGNLFAIKERWLPMWKLHTTIFHIIHRQ